MLFQKFAHKHVRAINFGIVPKVVAFVLAMSLSVHVSAAEAPLTLAEALRLAVERSRSLPAKDYAALASREMAVAAGQLPDPVLTAGVENLPVNGADRFSLTSDFMTMRSIGVMQEFTGSDKRHWRSKRYSREAERSEAEKNEVLASIQRETALAWLGRYYAEAMAKVVAEEGTQAKLEIKAAEGNYRAGQSSQTDVISSRSGLKAFDNRVSEAERRVRNAKITLVRWIGSDSNNSLASLPETDSIRLDLANLENHIAHHPSIIAFTKKVEVAEAEANLAQANKKADWSVGVMYQQRGPAFSNMASINVSIPLQWDRANRQDRELSAKLAMVEEAKAERDELLRTHVAEVRVMISEWENNRERIARYERDLIPLAQQRTLASIAAYRGGKTALSDVLNARRNEIDMRLEALQLQTDTAQLWAKLNYLFPDDSLVANSTVSINRINK